MFNIETILITPFINLTLSLRIKVLLLTYEEILFNIHIYSAAV
jgi:hypothetical protein